MNRKDRECGCKDGEIVILWIRILHMVGSNDKRCLSVDRDRQWRRDDNVSWFPIRRDGGCDLIRGSLLWVHSWVLAGSSSWRSYGWCIGQRVKLRAAMPRCNCTTTARRCAPTRAATALILASWGLPFSYRRIRDTTFLYLKFSRFSVRVTRDIFSNKLKSTTAELNKLKLRTRIPSQIQLQIVQESIFFSFTELAEYEARSRDLLPYWLKLKFLPKDDRCDATYAQIGAIDSYTQCAHLFLGPACDYCVGTSFKILLLIFAEFHLKYNCHRKLMIL